jgi:palmitoyltransferase
LMPDIDFSEPGKWCRKCWAPKPERTHHCSACGRCVLKMDHHCPWLGSICIGHRTYPAFVHFLGCITIFATYIAVISINALIYAFSNPYGVSEVTPVHELFLACTGIIFAAIVGSFFGYHVYLSLTNQTTLENISPFFFLKHLPRLPPSGHSLSDPPLEGELSYMQRSLVKDAHGYIRLYDIGWRKNLAQTFGCRRKSHWMYRLWCGGASPGDGRTFPRNPNADRVLTRLADELVKADRNT